MDWSTFELTGPVPPDQPSKPWIDAPPDMAALAVQDMNGNRQSISAIAARGRT